MGLLLIPGVNQVLYGYLPLDLDPSFHRTELVVSFTANGRPDVITISQWGLPVNIVRMKKLT